MKKRPLTIVYPTYGDASHKHLARRVAVACEDLSLPVAVYDSNEFTLMDEVNSRDQALMIVMPSECIAVGGSNAAFLSKVSATGKRLLLLSTALEDKKVKAQLELPIEYDAFVDVGIVYQKNKYLSTGIPYRFLFDGASRSERRTLERQPSGGRPIPWALVDVMKRTRAMLLAELVENLDPGGFVLLHKNREAMPELSGNTSWKLNSEDLSRILSRTKYYVWNSLPGFEYYESQRLRTALLSGAVPCKIDRPGSSGGLDVPWVFPSVSDLEVCIKKVGFKGMFQRSRKFYLSRGLLSENLEEVLKDVF